MALPRLLDVHGNYIPDLSYKEITKLVHMLRDAGIPHTVETMMDGWHICYPNKVRGKKNMLNYRALRELRARGRPAGNNGPSDR